LKETSAFLLEEQAKYDLKHKEYYDILDNTEARQAYFSKLAVADENDLS